MFINLRLVEFVYEFSKMFVIFLNFIENSKILTIE